MQGGAGDGIGVSFKLRNVQRGIRQEDTMTESISPCCDFEGHAGTQKGRVRQGFAGIYVD